MDQSLIEEYTAFNQFLIRTPLFPLNFVDSFEGNTIKSILNNPLIKEAIYLASPILYSEIEKWLDGEIRSEKEVNRILFSSLRYLIRMSTRCTPFGLFAGCSIGRWNNSDFERSILLSKQSTYTSHTRLDMQYLCSLAQNLAKEESIKYNLLFYPNSSLYKQGNQLRYVEYKYINNRRIHQLVSIDNSEYLSKVMKSCSDGLKIYNLASLLIDEEISYDEAVNYILELIDSQILISELEPALTGPEFLEQILIILNKIEGIDDIKNILYKTKMDIASIDNTIIGRNYIEYINISTNIQSLGVDFEPNFLFQADLVKPTISNSLNKSISTNVIEALSILNRLVNKDEKTNLTQFCDAFNNRYEGKEISLIEALDTETGIGYLQGNKNIGDICPLVDEVYIPVKNKTYSEVKWDHLSTFILKKYLDAIKNDRNEIILTDEEIATLPDSGNILPDTLGCMLQLSEDKIHISNVGGSSAANLISRFCHSDEEILLLAREITEKEQQLNQNVIYAEIVHLPKARAGNVLLRPILRNFEIPYLARPYIEKNQQISLDDLMISVHGSKIMLRSKRLGKEIVPRLTTAHNYSQDALPIYHFLCDLQTQNTNSRIGFSWGIFQNEFSFLPRVSYKNIILSLAQWNLNKDDFRELLNVERSLLSEKFIKWLNKFRLPRYFSLLDGDNELIIDSENKLCVETFIDTIKKRDYIKLSEFFFEKNKSIVIGNEGCYANELIVTFYKIKKEIEEDNFAVSLTNLPEANIKQSIKRSFLPGDEWLYLKFYMGTLIADQFIVQFLDPLTEDLLNNNIIDKFYFVRYHDPDYHIRIRFHCSNTALSSCIFARIRKYLLAFANINLIWKVQYDTYNREIERYGTNKMQLSETLFFHESQMIVKVLKFLLEEEDDAIRWQISLRAIDTYLDDFHYDIYQKMNFMQILSTGYDKEFHMNKESRYTISKQYRKDRPLIDEVLKRNPENAEKWGNYSKFIMKRSNSIINLVNEMASMKKEAFPEVTMNELLGSYIHMLCNRLFRSKHRLQELVIYSYLFNYYKSQIARLKN